MLLTLRKENGDAKLKLKIVFEDNISGRDNKEGRKKRG
jgi:hypothetical protein